MTSTARPEQSATRDQQVVRILVIILFANLAVAAAELIYGFMSGSNAIRADGFHSVVDGSNNVVALLLARAAAQPPDREHPYGHRKYEVIGSAAIGIAVLLMVWEVGRDAIQGLSTEPSLPNLGYGAYAVMAVTMAANIVITVYEHWAARRYNSQLLSADAKHTLADIFVKTGVTAGVVGYHLGFHRADSLAAIGVLGFIAWVGFGILRRGVRILMDEAALPPEEVALTAVSVEGVHRVRRIRSRGIEGDIRVDLIIEVDPALTLMAAHDISEAVERAVHERWSGVAEVVVHVEPATKPYT